MIIKQLPGLGSNVLPSGTYRIGPGDFFTPGDLQSDAGVLDGQVQALDAQVSNNGNIPPSWLTSWKAYKTAWDSFYSDHFGGLFGGLFSSWTTALNDSNRDDLVRYETQFSQWYQDAQGYGSSLPAGAVTDPSTGPGDSLSKQLAAAGLPSGAQISDLLTKAIWVGGGVAALWIGFQIYNAAKKA